MDKYLLYNGLEFIKVVEFGSDEELSGFMKGLQIANDLLHETFHMWHGSALKECDKDFPAIAKLIREHLIEKEESDE